MTSFLRDIRKGYIRPILGSTIQWEMACSGVMSQTELARISGVSKGVINAIMTGRTTHPDVWTMARIADGLKVPLDRLINPKSEYIPCLSEQEQRIISTYRTGRKRWRKTMDLIVEWDAEDRAEETNESEASS